MTFPAKYLDKGDLFLGHVSWDEYKVKFLASKGHNEREIADAIKNHEELKVDEESECWVPASWMSGHCAGIGWAG